VISAAAELAVTADSSAHFGNHPTGPHVVKVGNSSLTAWPVLMNQWEARQSLGTSHQAVSVARSNFTGRGHTATPRVTRKRWIETLQMLNAYLFRGNDAAIP